MYNQIIVERAKELYIAKDENPERIAEILKSENEKLKISGVTIRKWVKIQKWDEEKQRNRNEVTKRVNEKIVFDSARSREVLSDIANGIVEDLSDPNLKLRTKGEGVYSLTNIIQVMKTLGNTVDSAVVVNMVMDILFSRPKIKKAIMPEINDIMQEIAYRMQRNNGNSGKI